MAGPSEPIAITGLPESYMAEDASRVRLHFERDNGEHIVLEATASVFNRIVTRLTELLSGLHLQRGAVTGHLEIRATDAVATTAEAPVGGGKVIVGFRTGNGLVHHFALSPDQANELRIAMRKAETSARDQAAKSRQ